MKTIVKNIQVKSVLTKSNLPVADYSVNPYVGCGHGCKYCYASFMKRFTNHSEPWGSFVDVKYWPEIKNPQRYAGKELFIGSVRDPRCELFFHSFHLMGLPSFEGKRFANYMCGNQNAVWLYMGQTLVQIASLDDLRGKISFLKELFAYTLLDDIEHYQTTRLTLPVRKGTLAMEKLLKRADIVKEPHDMFFCHMDSLQQFVKGKLTKAELKKRIAAEKAAYLKNQERTSA